MTKKLNDVSVALNEREQVILQALRDLYSSKQGVLLVSINMIAYRLTGRFFDKSVEKDARMLHNMKETVLSLDKKRVIRILDQETEHFLVSSKNLKVKSEKCMKEKSLQERTIKISDEKQVEFYINYGLVPIRKYFCELSEKIIWEFNRDEENKKVYKKL